MHVPPGQGGLVASREGGLAEGLARRGGLQLDARHAAEVGVRLVHLRGRGGAEEEESLPPAVVEAARAGASHAGANELPSQAP